MSWLSAVRKTRIDRQPAPARHRQLAADASETKPGIMIVSRHGPPSAQVVRRGNTKLWENLAAQAPLKHIASWNKGEPFIIMWNYLKFNVKTKFQLLLQKSITLYGLYPCYRVWYNTKENGIYFGVRSREENPFCLGEQSLFYLLKYFKRRLKINAI